MDSVSRTRKIEEIIRRLSCQRRSKQRIRPRESRATSHLRGGGPSVFFGEKEEWKSAENSNRPSFALTLSCDSSSVKRRERAAESPEQKKEGTLCLPLRKRDFAGNCPDRAGGARAQIIRDRRQLCCCAPSPRPPPSFLTAD